MGKKPPTLQKLLSDDSIARETALRRQRPSEIEAKLAAIAGRDPVSLKYLGERRGTWRLNLRSSRRTVDLSARAPVITLSHAEAEEVLRNEYYGSDFQPV